MSLSRNRLILSCGIERIDVRNLLPPPGVDITVFSPSIEVIAVCKSSDGTTAAKNYSIYNGECQNFSCNPSWTSIAGFDSSPFAGQSQVTELLVRFHCKYPESDEDLVFHEASIDVGKLFLLQENFSIAALSTVPRNSIFLWVDDKEVLMENSLYLSLRKSNQIKARNGSMLAHLEDKAADPGGPDAEEVLNESILSDMNSLLVDEDERNVALRSDIDAGTSRVDTLRAEAEVFLAGRPTSTRDPSTALQLLELQELQAQVERAEAEAVAEQRALEEERAGLEGARQQLETSLRRWKDVTTRDSHIKSTEELISRKKSELIHTKFLLDARRLKLFGELSTIYPICKVSRDPTDRSSGAGLLRSSSNVSSAAGAGDEDCYSIRGVELPLLIDNSLKDDEQISTALGYIVHILLLTSKYLQISLRYEVTYSSSRSTIRDAVLGRGSTLPLYKRGVERERFDRALLWLQKDLEQLLDRMDHKYSRAHSMLFNLKQLFDCEICPELLS